MLRLLWLRLGRPLVRELLCRLLPLLAQWLHPPRLRPLLSAALRLLLLLPCKWVRCLLPLLLWLTAVALLCWPYLGCVDGSGSLQRVTPSRSKHTVQSSAYSRTVWRMYTGRPTN